MTEEITPHNQPRESNSAEENEHRKAVEFVNRNRDYFEHYARGNITVEPAPPGLDTFATDLKKGKIYVHGRFYKDHGHDLSDEKTSFAVLHELGHLEERMQMLNEKNGARLFKKYLDQIDGSQAYSLMDNCVGDIRENKTVVSRTHEGFAQTEQALYKEDLFKDADMTAAPRHVQFCQALLRESQVPDERCAVAPEVRAELDELHAIKAKNGKEMLDIMTDPALPMSIRLKIQDRYIWPRVKELMDRDMQDRKDKKGGTGRKGGSEKSGAPEDKNGSTAGENDPNKIFADAYAEAQNKIPHAVPIDEIKKDFEKWEKERGENSLDQADREYADNLGVTLEDLRRYRDIVASLDRIVNPETNERVVEELYHLFNRIIARRLKPRPAPRYPTEEGEELTDPAELYTQVQKGNLEPRAWETTEFKERKGRKFGEIEITLVCDRSSSMNGSKLDEQRKAAVLVMEALKEFADQCDQERVNMDQPLEIRSEIYSFQSSGQDTVPLKKMSKELGEKERVEVAAVLSSAPGSTTDFVPLENILGGLTDEIKQKIADGGLKKIIIVFTDGVSDNPSRVKTVLGDLRGKGVIAVGVGITREGQAALDTYAPNARLAEKAENLATVLGDLLKEHLADL